MKRIKLFLFNIGILITSSFIFRSIDIYFTSYLSRTIGAENLGLYQLIMSFYLFGITLATSGINLTTTKLIAEAQASSNPGRTKSYMTHIITFSLIISILTSSIIHYFAAPICYYAFNNKISINIIYLICLALPFISLSSAIAGYFAGVRRIYKNAIGQFFEHIFKVIICTIFLNYLLPNNLNFACFSLILGDLLSEIFSFIYIYIIFGLDINKYSSPNHDKLNINTFSKILKITLPISITTSIRTGLYTFKQVIIPKVLTKCGLNYEKALSNYGLINGMALPIILFPDILVRNFASLLVPEFSRYHYKKDFNKSTKIAKLLLKLTLFLSIVLTVILIISSDVIAKVLYSNENVSYYIKLLSPLAIFIYADTVVDSILKGLDKQVGVMIINIFDLIINTSFIYFLVPILGIEGYLISIYISEILNFSCSLTQLIIILKKQKS